MSQAYKYVHLLIYQNLEYPTRYNTLYPFHVISYFAYAQLQRSSKMFSLFCLSSLNVWRQKELILKLSNFGLILQPFEV